MLFSKFNVVNGNEITSANNLFAEALKEPIEDFKKMPWKDLLKKYDKYSLRNWMSEVFQLFFPFQIKY
jgi:hypothetical protein